MKKEEIGVVSAYKQFVMRAYKVPEKMDGKSIAEIESEFSPERVFVERVKNAQGVFDAEPDLRLHAGNLIVLSGRPRECSEERAIRCNTTGSKVVLERGDMLTLIGAKRHVDRVAARLGPVERASHATDLTWLCLAIGIGGLLGLPAIHVRGLTIGLGLPVCVLLALFVIGWLHSIRPLFGRVPEPAIWLLDSLGLNGFMATVGISAGPSFVRGLRSSGLELLVTGLIVSTVPCLLTIPIGRYIFR